MRPRRLLAALALVAVLAGAALALYWNWAAEQVTAAIAEWAEDRRAHGYEVAYGGPEVGGFPLRLTVLLDAPSMTSPHGWRWTGAALAGEAAVWEPEVLRLDLPRRQTLSGEWRGRTRAIDIEAEAARGRVHLGRGGWMQASVVEMDGVVLSEGQRWTTRAEHLRYEVTRRPPTVEDTRDWTLLMRGLLEGVGLPDGVEAPFGDTVQRLELRTTLMGAIPPGEPAEALARWRDAGGQLAVDELLLRWGPLDIAADGTTTLDAALRPAGALTARIRGLPRAIQVLADRGLIDRDAALAVKLAALALAEPQDDGGKPVIRLPVTLRDGVLYLGPVAVARFAPVL